MFKIEVKPDGGDAYTVTAEARDVLAWEKASEDGRTYLDLSRGGTLVDVYALAYIASKRQGLFEGSRAQFEKTCDINILRWMNHLLTSVVGSSENSEPDPTQTEASTGS